MEFTLEEAIARTNELARSRKLEDAFSIAADLLKRFPNEMRVWLLRGYLHSLTGEYSAATADLSRAIELNSMEPHLFYSRGTYLFQMGDDTSAIEDFTKALELCDYYKDDYYREELHFWRAEASLRTGRKLDALKDLASVRSDFVSWTYALRTKGDLLSDAAL
jgi:tetratricopeptide (TPR) repeat protein